MNSRSFARPKTIPAPNTADDPNWPLTIAMRGMVRWTSLSKPWPPADSACTKQRLAASRTANSRRLIILISLAKSAGAARPVVSVRSCPVHLGVKPVHGCPGGHVQAMEPFAPVAVARYFRGSDGALVAAVPVEHPDARGAGHPHVALLVGLEPVGDPLRLGLQLGEHLPVAQHPVARYLVDPDVPLAAIGDVEFLLVGSERDAVGAIAIARDRAHFSRTRHLVDDLRRQVGEIHAAVDGVHQVVGMLDLRAARQHGDTAVLFRTRDAVRFAGQQASLVVEGQAIGSVAVLPEYRDAALLPFHDALGGDVAEEQVAQPAEHRPLREGEACGYLFDLDVEVHHYDPLPCA